MNKTGPKQIVYPLTEEIAKKLHQPEREALKNLEDQAKKNNNMLDENIIKKFNSILIKQDVNREEESNFFFKFVSTIQNLFEKQIEFGNLDHFY